MSVYGKYFKDSGPYSVTNTAWGAAECCFAYPKCRILCTQVCLIGLLKGRQFCSVCVFGMDLSTHVEHSHEIASPNLMISYMKTLFYIGIGMAMFTIEISRT